MCHCDRGFEETLIKKYIMSAIQYKVLQPTLHQIVDNDIHYSSGRQIAD